MGRLIVSTQVTLDGVMTVGEWFNCAHTGVEA